MTRRKLLTAVVVAITLVFPIGNTTLNLINFLSVHNAQQGLGTLTRENAALVKRVAHDEHTTCLIQRRGLPAGHELAASMKVIYVLLTLPPSPTAAPTPPKIERLILALDSHLASYLQAEAKQPLTRSCVTR